MRIRSVVQALVAAVAIATSTACASPPAAAQSTPILPPFAASAKYRIGTITAGGVTIITTSPTVIVDFRDLSGGVLANAQNPLVGQDPSISISCNELTSTGAVGAEIISLTGLGNGQSLPPGDGQRDADDYYAPYGVVCFASSALTGGGIAIEGRNK